MTVRDEGTKYEVRGYGMNCRPMKRTTRDKAEALQVADPVFTADTGWNSMYDRVFVIEITTTTIKEFK